MNFINRTLFKALIVLCMVYTNFLYGQSVITPNLQERLGSAKANEMIRINIRLKDQYDAELMRSKTAHFVTPEQKRSFVINELKVFSDESQKDLIAFLSNHEKSQKVDQVRPLWIVNLINCYATPDVIAALAQISDVVRIDYDQMRKVIEEVVLKDETSPIDKTYYNPNVAWNISLINAPTVWEEGFTGEGVVVAVLDTGVNPNHQDLAGRMWTHPNYPNHGYNFVNNNHVTMDNHSHGTHCAGTVAGNGMAGTTTGVAPGATIMALKVLGDDGSGTEAGVWTAIQFAVEYGASVMSLSLGWQHSWNPDRSAWRTAMVNAMNAGVIAAVAAGNEGDYGAAPPAQVRTPGDCPAPWTHPDQTSPGGNSAVVTVGSTTDTDAISSFSSKGPVTWQNIAPFNDYAYNPGTGLILPDIVAPGSNILSLSNTNNSGYTTKSGTSMATPAVAGLMALMISKNPNLTPQQISQILEESANSMSASKSNTFGSGRINAVSAIAATPYMGVIYAGHQINDSQGNNNGFVNPGETILLSLAMENPTENTLTNVSLQIQSSSEYITFTQNTANLGTFTPGQIKNFSNIFSFVVSNITPGNYQIPFELLATSPDGEEVVWRSSFLEMNHAPFLKFQDLVINDSQYGNSNGKLDPGETAIISIPIKNIGTVTSSHISFNVTTLSSWIFIHQPSTFVLSGLDPEAIASVSFQVTAMQQTPLESVSELMLQAQTGLYNFEEVVQIVVGEAPVYMLGDIPSTYNTNPSTTQSSQEPGTITVSIPTNATITGVDVEYLITSQGGAWLSEQRSFLRCTSPGGTTESTVSQGPSSNSAGTHTYNRTGLNIANGVTGISDVQFQLHVFRTWGGSGSNTQYAYVPNGTWKVIVHYVLPLQDVTLKITNQLDEVVENATIVISGVSKETDEYGEVDFELTQGSHLCSISAPKHKPVDAQVIHVTGNNLIELQIEKLFDVAFNITNPSGNTIENATVFINDTQIEGNLAENIANGWHDFHIRAEGYRRIRGSFEVNNQDIVLNYTMIPIYNVAFNITDNYGNDVVNAEITLNNELIEGTEVGNLEDGTYIYNISAEGYFDKDGSFEIDGQDVTVSETLTFIHGVSFIVSDTDGNLIENVSISLNNEIIDGTEVEHIDDGVHNFTITAEGYQQVVGSFEMNGQALTIDVTMYNAYSISFLVNNPEGNTIENLTVSINSNPIDGNYLEHLDNGEYEYLIVAEGYRDVAGSFVMNSQNMVIEVTMYYAYGVTFIITDAEGNIIENPSIKVNDEPIDGTEINHLENGQYEYLIVAEGFRRESGSFEMNNESIVIEKTMLRAFNVTFNVTNESGEQLTEAEITIDGTAYETGVFEFIELLVGEYSYSVSAPQHITETGSFEVIDNHIELNITLLFDNTSSPVFQALSINISPNPADKYVRVRFSAIAGKSYGISLTNHLGQELRNLRFNGTTSPAEVEMNLDGIPAGLYIIRVNDGSQSINQKLIVW